jgi:adenylyl-sulfate kinase
MAGDLTRQHSDVTASERRELLGQHGAVVWLTGLSGSGKSTIAYGLERRLVGANKAAFVLDGDNVRMGLCADLGFSPEDRDENIRRIGEIGALFADAGVIAITAFISPYREARARARATVGADRFIEVHLDASLEVCEARDPKGLYKRARSGEISDFTGVSAPYNVPESPEVVLRTGDMPIEECLDVVVAHLTERGFLQG